MEVNDTVPPGVAVEPVPVTVAVRVTAVPTGPGLDEEETTTVEVAVPAISSVTLLAPVAGA